MVISDANLNSMILDFQNKINIAELKHKKLRKLLSNAVSIQQINIPDPTPEDIHHTKKVIPLDPKLGITITPERRQAIYDKIISDMEGSST